MSAALSLGLAAGYLGLFGFKLLGTGRALRARPARAEAPAPGRVSVLTPILGGDPELQAVLEDHVRALQGVCFIWLVDVDDPVGRGAAEAVRTAHPGRPIEILVCPPAPPGINPKTFKLDLALARVNSPIFLVLDDDARLPAASLARLVAELDGADLVTGLPFYRDAGPLPDRLLAQFVNNNAALTYLALLPWRPPVSINGMCYLMATARWRAWGGFAPLAHQLADDLAVALRLRAAGARVHQSAAPVAVRTSVGTPRRYLQQMHRWFLFATLLMRAQPASTRLLITLLYGLHPLALAGLLASAVASPGAVSAGALGLTLAVRAAGLAWTQRRLTGRVRHRPLLSLASELLQPLHLLHGAAVRRIQWRSRRYLVRAHDDFAPL